MKFAAASLRDIYSGGFEMLLMKACEKCQGSLLIEEEGRMKDLVCLQCGFRPADGAQRAEQILRARALQRRRVSASRAMEWAASAAG